jgi:hypothetical protein
VRPDAKSGVLRGDLRHPGGHGRCGGLGRRCFDRLAALHLVRSQAVVANRLFVENHGCFLGFTSFTAGRRYPV